MFNYPIPPLRGGAYAELGLSPEATAEEINEACQALASRLKARQKSVQRDLESVYQEVPGLREAWEKLKGLEDSDSDPNEFRKVQLELTGLEEQAAQVRPDFLSLRDELGSIQHQIHQVNLMEIQNPDDRIEYDRSHPPLELIKLEDCHSSPLDDAKTMLRMVRAELSDFFEQSGEAVFHPSDLTQNDFSRDFSVDQNLDHQS